MDISCPKCRALNKFDEADYIPGSTNIAECWRCGEELTFTMPGTAPVKSSTEVAVKKAATPAAKEYATPVAQEYVTPVADQSAAELEKARLALEAERIRLEHRKMDHEREMSMMAQQQNNGNNQVSHVYQEIKSRKDKTTAGLLGIFLGGLGAHKFYLGKTGQGILYLLFCWTYIPAILGLIEGITYLAKNEHDFHANSY